MTPPDVRFGCVGCGACCTGRYIPLTLDEDKQWLERGDDVGILVEAFDAPTWPGSHDSFEHSLWRSAQVLSGESSLQVIAIFAGKAIPRCPNLRDNGMCDIYDIRPLVCRIYPMEINPFVDLVPASKDCPPLAWEGGEVLVTDRVMEPIMSRNIASSRAADRSDAKAKVAICEDLGLTTAAWKGKGLAIYEPEREVLLAAIERCKVHEWRSSQSWSVRTDDDLIVDYLAHSGMDSTHEAAGFQFHQF